MCRHWQRFSPLSAGGGGGIAGRAQSNLVTPFTEISARRF